MTLGDAFAHSTNGIFGKVGVRYLGKKMLANYASAFGFNEIMPFEFPVQESAFNKYDDDMVTEARTAASWERNIESNPCFIDRCLDCQSWCHDETLLH